MRVLVTGADRAEQWPAALRALSLDGALPAPGAVGARRLSELPAAVGVRLLHRAARAR